MYTPLYSALLNLKEKNQLSFHMPGHFDGKAMDGFENLLQIDTTEVPESDNLFAASGPIAQAENAAAKFFGAKKTRFLVNGSSAGILAMVGASVSEGDKIICDRFCHRSFISALILSGASPVWVYPELLEGGKMWGGINPDDIEKAAKENPDAKAVYITAPNYFGFSCDVAAIAKIARKYSMTLLVDGAHGAHYGLSPLLPPSAIGMGADIVVVSAHKTLPSVTQSAYLHINADLPRLEEMLKMHQTSSPSYILMASLDYARAKMEKDGNRLWTALAEQTEDIFPEQKELRGKYVKYKDICRLVLPTSPNPFEAAEELRQNYNISVECAYGGGVVCIANIAHSRKDLLRLREAIDKINCRPRGERAVFAPVKSAAVITPRQAFYREGIALPLREALGRVCAREVLAYPPGVAQLMPGELITSEAVDEIERMSAMGAEIHGIRKGKITVVR